jgi:hypothetical protein
MDTQAGTAQHAPARRAKQQPLQDGTHVDFVGQPLQHVRAHERHGRSTGSPSAPHTRCRRALYTAAGGLCLQQAGPLVHQERERARLAHALAEQLGGARHPAAQ